MRVVVEGAGAVGRALIGRIFCNAGHRVAFVEKQMEITRRLQTNNYYPLQTGKGLQWVGPVAAVMPGAEQEELNSADLIVCCVRVGNMGEVATSLANVFVGRPKESKRVDVLVVENMPRADLHLQNETEIIANETLNNVIFNMGIAECVIPEVDPDVQLLDPALMNGDESGYLVVSKELQRQLGRTRTRDIKFVDDMNFAWDLKWYCHCAFHVVLAFVGLARGMIYIDEVANCNELNIAVDELCVRIRNNLAARFPGTLAMIDTRLYRTEWHHMAVPQIRDTCARVARDPARKVAPGERLRDLEALIGGHPLVTEAIQQAERMANK